MKKGLLYLFVFLLALSAFVPVLAVDKSAKLLIYTNSGSNGRAEWIMDYAKQAGYNIEVVNIPGGELGNRLVAEKNNAQADLVFGLNAVEYEKLKKESILKKYEPVWASEVDMTLGDKDGYYYPIVIQPLVLIHNPEYKDVPSDWIDLTADKYKDQYKIFGLGGGTSKTILSSILTRYQDPNGELGISDEGWDVCKKYVQNAHLEVQGEDSIGDLISGKRPMQQMWGSGVIQNQEERGYKFGVMSPEIGVPYVTEQVAIIAASKKTELAEDFANWFGTADVQAAWSKQFGTIPAQPKALEQSKPDVLEFMQLVSKPQKMDWGFIAANVDSWIEKVELEFVE